MEFRLGQAPPPAGQTLNRLLKEIVIFMRDVILPALSQMLVYTPILLVA